MTMEIAFVGDTFVTRGDGALTVRGLIEGEG